MFQEDTHRIRHLHYAGVDAFIICFDLSDKNAFHNVVKTWVPELAYYCPGTPRLLVGCKKGNSYLKNYVDSLNNDTHGPYLLILDRSS